MAKLLLRMSEEEKHQYSESAHEARMTMSEWMRSVLNEAAALGNIPSKAKPLERDAPKTLSDIREMPGITTGDKIQSPFLPSAPVYPKRPEMGPDGYPIIEEEHYE